VIDADDTSRLIEPGHANPIVRSHLAPGLAERDRRGRLTLDRCRLFLKLRALLVGLVLFCQCFDTRRFRLGFQLLQAQHFWPAPLLAVEIPLRPRQQSPRQFEPSSDLEGVAHTKLANM
jgi:hypothetical protein